MSFVYPAFLSAFALLAIPVIIHLFNFKKFQRFYFPDISFLKEVKEKTKKQSQLKHLLVLLCRLMVFTFLVLAFAQPFSGSIQSASPNKVVSIYIDNSFSMEAQGKNSSLLDLARQKATDIVNGSAQSTRFQVLTNEFSPVSQRLYSREEALEQIENISIFPVSRKIQEVLSRQEELLKTIQADNLQLIHISDFQKTSAQYTNSGKNYPLTLIPLQTQVTGNISIDSVWFNNPLHAINASEELFFRLKNHDPGNDESVTLQVFINNRQKSLATVTVPAGNSIDSSIAYTNTETGLMHGKLVMNDKQIFFDDQLYFTYSVEPFIRVAAINDFTKPQDSIAYDIKNIFSNDPYYQFRSFTRQNIDFALLKQQQCIVLNRLDEISTGMQQELEKFVSSGGSVCIIPASNINLESYNNFLRTLSSPTLTKLDTHRTMAEKPDFNDPFFSGIFEKQPYQLDVPIIKKHYTSTTSSRSLTQPILRLKNGSDLISITRYKRGKVFLFSAPTSEDAGNLGQHALFVPIVLRMAELSLTSGKLYNVFGPDAGFEIKPLSITGDNLFKLLETETKESIIPEFRNDGNNIQVFFNNNIKTAGNYNLLLDEKLVNGTSINYPRTESTLESYSATELRNMLTQAGFTQFNIYDKPIDDSKIDLSVIDNTHKYWILCVWLVIFFLLAETAILKFWKT